jgi:hypothetical protein
VRHSGRVRVHRPTTLLLALVAVLLLAVAVNRVAAGAEDSPTEHPPIVVTPNADDSETDDPDDKNDPDDKDDKDDDDPDRVGQDPRSIDDDDDDDLDRD